MRSSEPGTEGNPNSAHRSEWSTWLVPRWPRGRDGDRVEQQVGVGQGTGSRMGQWASGQETMEVLGEGP